MLKIIRRAASNSSKKLPVLELFTKAPCPLCDEALEAIAGYSHQFELQKVDITLPNNKHWWDLYKFDIPVFHFEGKFLMKHKADIAALEAVLKAYRHST